MSRVRRGSEGKLLKIAFMFTILTLLVVFGFWAQNTKLDLLTRGMGVVAAEENKSVQSAETGTIIDFRVSKGDFVERNSVLATINPTAAQGSSLDELISRRDTIKVQINPDLMLRSTV